eukprot:COSAG04_NODE_6633_length_1288_cov_1.024390_2_plen_266_part_01
MSGRVNPLQTAAAYLRSPCHAAPRHSTSNGGGVPAHQHTNTITQWQPFPCGGSQGEQGSALTLRGEPGAHGLALQPAPEADPLRRAQQPVKHSQRIAVVPAQPQPKRASVSRRSLFRLTRQRTDDSPLSGLEVCQLSGRWLPATSISAVAIGCAPGRRALEHALALAHLQPPHHHRPPLIARLLETCCAVLLRPEGGEGLAEGAACRQDTHTLVSCVSTVGKLGRSNGCVTGWGSPLSLSLSLSLDLPSGSMTTLCSPSSSAPPTE